MWSLQLLLVVTPIIISRHSSLQLLLVVLLCAHDKVNI